MMSPSRRQGLGSIPKERDYEDNAAGAMAYGRDMAEWLRAYVDATDDHRKRSVETWTATWGEMVGQHHADLQPKDTPRPGWVARDLANLASELIRLDVQREKDNEAVMKEARRVRRFLTVAIVTSLSALVTLLGTLIAQFILRGGTA